MSRENNIILLTGVERSGTAMISRILNICHVFKGDVDKMYENQNISAINKLYICANSITHPYPSFVDSFNLNWKNKITIILKNQGYKEQEPWMYKSSLLTQTWHQWHQWYPTAKWLIIRRKSSDIVNSCIKTGYMHLFKSKENRKIIDAKTEQEAWRWWIHQYEKSWMDMFEVIKLNYKVIWPDRMEKGDYAQIYEMLNWLGLKWNKNIPIQMDSLFAKERKKW